MGFVNEISDGYWRTIDREQGFILKSLGSGRDSDYTFELFIGQDKVRFEAVYQGKIYGNPKLGEVRLQDVMWHINRLYIPENMQARKKEIIDLIKEALVTRGWNYRQDCVHSVQVELSPSLI